MKEEFSIEFKGLWANFKGIVKNILMILMLVVFSPIVLLESWFNKVKWEIGI